MLDEELDDVKHFNQVMLYTQCVTIRDKQLDEQQHLEQDWLDEQKRLDSMMEIERLKNLKYQIERDVKKKEAQKQGKVIEF